MNDERAQKPKHIEVEGKVPRASREVRCVRFWGGRERAGRGASLCKGKPAGFRPGAGLLCRERAQPQALGSPGQARFRAIGLLS
jgi:hypothetical protein